MDKMIISFMPDGSVQHTLKDAAFKPELGGTKRIVERMTEIKHDTERDMFYAQMVGEDIPITAIDCITIGLDNCDIPNMRSAHIDFEMHQDGVILYDKYEDAVILEIAYTNKLRLLGHSLAPKA